LLGGGKESKIVVVVSSCAWVVAVVAVGLR